MSLKTAREELVTVIRAAGIKTFYGTGAFTTPCARVFPAEPWVAPSSLADGKRTQRWEVWAVAGRVDSNATYNDIEDLVQDISTALEPLRNWSRLNWSRPTNVIMGGVQYSACRGIIETREAV